MEEYSAGKGMVRVELSEPDPPLERRDLVFLVGAILTIFVLAALVALLVRWIGWG